jgi:hypothetical protein
MDAKKFLFLSASQRWIISIALNVAIAISLFGIFFAHKFPEIQALSTTSLEVLKLLLTAGAAWVFVLLYASSNSFARIEKETLRFLTADLRRPSIPVGLSVNDIKTSAIEADASVKMQCISMDRTSVTYKLSSSTGCSIYLWCNLNVNEFACIFILPEDHANNYKQIYAATLKGFARRGLDVTNFGLVGHKFEQGKTINYLELYVVRDLEADFLFDAAARVRVSQLLWGDLRSFLVCAERHTEKSTETQQQAK